MNKVRAKLLIDMVSDKANPTQSEWARKQIKEHLLQLGLHLPAGYDLIFQFLLSLLDAPESTIPWGLSTSNGVNCP